MKDALNGLKKKIIESDGFLTAKGQLYDRAELFHTFLPSVFLGIMAMTAVFGALFTAVVSASKLSGHLGDFRKNVGYGVAGFFLGYLPHLQVIPLC